MIKGYWYGFDSEYLNLSDEEKQYMDYFNNCLFNESEVIMKSCFDMMMLLLQAGSSIDTENEMTQDEVLDGMNKIYSVLNEEDKEKVESFVYACIQCMGIYSDESKKQRRLNKKGND